MTASKLAAPGRISLAYFADTRGRIVTETSVVVHSDEDVVLITAAAAQWHDAELFSRTLPEGLTLTDHSDERECLLVTGPKAREVLAPLTEGHDLDRPWLSVSTEGSVAGKPCTLARVSFAGELGWEVHCLVEDAPEIWDAVTTAGAKPFGMYALDRLRLEKGYRAWKGDLSTDYTLLEGGLDRFIDWSKSEFPGLPALQAEKQRGPAKRCVSLVLDLEETDAPYMSTLWQNGSVVGEITSSGWGYRVNAAVALGMVRADLAVPGQALEAEVFGKRYAARVHGETALWDPKNERLRA